MDLKSSISSPSASTPMHASIQNNISLPSLNSLFAVLEEIKSIESSPDETLLMPPINQMSLQEINMDDVIGNLELRHEIYFDETLQFKPNSTAEKQANAQRYWSDFNTELSLGNFKRIPILLNQVLLILCDLIPSSDAEFREIIDVELIMQSIKINQFNPKSLLLSIGQLLKTHCSPARDALVDQMINVSESEQYANTFQLTFEILEFMRLDSTNYQLKCIRPFILEKAVDFEWNYFQTGIKDKSIQCSDTIKWLSKYGKTSTETTTHSRYLKACIEMIRLLPENDSIPETFHLDHKRLNVILSDFQDISILSVLILLFKQLCGPRVNDSHISELKSAIWILLNDNETSLEDVILELCHRAGNIRGFAISKEERTAFSNKLSDSLAPSSVLYGLLQTRIQTQILNICTNNASNDESLVSSGLNHVSQELDVLGKKIHKLLDFNWRVYFRLYNSIFQ